MKIIAIQINFFAEIICKQSKNFHVTMADFGLYNFFIEMRKLFYKKIQQIT